MFFVIVIRRLVAAVRRGFGDTVFRGLFYLTVTLLIIGAFAFHRIEGWTFFQSLYFSVITLTTIGYGDFSPVTFAGRLFTMIYVLAGVGIIVALVSRIAANAAEARAERAEQRRRRREA